jgi:hypothetical protein
MSPEVDLLDHLLVENIGLDLVLQLFARDGSPADTARKRAQRVIEIYARSGYIRVYLANKLVATWQLRSILGDSVAWTHSVESRERITLELTDAGYDAYVRASEGFFKRLFGEQGTLGKRRRSK